MFELCDGEVERPLELDQEPLRRLEQCVGGGRFEPPPEARLLRLQERGELAGRQRVENRKLFAKPVGIADRCGRLERLEQGGGP